jgi:hypothetical protein
VNIFVVVITSIARGGEGGGGGLKGTAMFIETYNLIP